MAPRRPKDIEAELKALQDLIHPLIFSNVDSDGYGPSDLLTGVPSFVITLAAQALARHPQLSETASESRAT